MWLSMRNELPHEFRHGKRKTGVDGWRFGAGVSRVLIQVIKSVLS
jgi:hypothetical protein